MLPEMSLHDRLSNLARLSAPIAMATVVEVSTALDSTDDRDALGALADALPRRVAGLAPEVSVALAEVATRLVPYGARTPDDGDALTDHLRIAWLRVQVVAGGAVPEAADLRRVVAGWPVDAVRAPLPILQTLAAAEDPALRLICLDWLPPALAGLGLTLSEAFELACALATDGAWAVRAAALRSVAFTTRAGLTLQQESRREDALLAGLHAQAFEVARATIAACAALARSDWLRDFVADAEQPVALRADALARFGAFAEATDLAWVLDVAAAPDLAEAGRECLLAAHRRGAFLAEDGLQRIVARFDANPAWTADELVRVTWIVRDALIPVLAALPADDPRWVRRAAVLAESPAAEAPVVLGRLLREATDLRVLHAVIEAAGRAPAFTAIDPLCDRLAQLPEVTLIALRAKADASALDVIEAFTRAPSVGPRTRRLAFDVLWAHRLDPGLAGRAGALAAVSPDSDLITDASPRARLTRLCKTGSWRVFSAVEATFREWVTDCVRRALAGDFSVKRIELPDVEQTIYRYGRALIANGLTVRRWTAEAPETGRDLLLQLICDWLDERPTRAVMVALLEMIARHAPDGPWLRRIEPLWRHGDREVRRAAVDAILAAGESAAGLALSLSRLVEAQSGRIAERGLEAIATFKARWAEPLVLRALGRPEMAVKKAAAGALGEIASAAAVPTILEWLGRHDNRGLRTALRAALATAAGPLQTAHLVATFADADDPRSRSLLLDALSGVLTLAGLLRLVATGHAAADALVDAALEDRLRLADATRDDAAARLHRLRIREAPDGDDPTAELLLFGFTPTRAGAVLDAWRGSADPRCLAAVRRRMAEWIAWCPDDDAAALALRAATRAHAQLLDGLLELTPRVDTAIALAFMQRCVVDPTAAQRQTAIDRVRALPDAPEPGGLARFELLLALGAVVTRADLERCLQECSMGSPRQAGALLRRAFAPLPSALREGPDAWHRLSDPARVEWLDAALAVRPLGSEAPKTAPQRRTPAPASIATLAAELAEPTTRDAALSALLARPAAASVWPEVLARVLAGELTLPRAAYSRLAAAMTAWPTEPAAHAIAMQWFTHLSAIQVRMFLPQWLQMRTAGDGHVDACLQAVDDEILLPVAWAQRGPDPTLARFIKGRESEGMRALAAWLAEYAPEEFARLRRPAPTTVADGPVDPIADLDLRGLQRLVAAKDTAHGLVVRAVHAMTAAGDAAIEPLAALADDRRPQVRSAALRALKTVAPRARSLEATLAALHVETRRDVALSLMRSLGHGRYAPSLPALIDRVVHRDVRIAGGAGEALRAFGADALPALAHAARRARPDRRAAYRALIAAIEG